MQIICWISHQQKTVLGMKKTVKKVSLNEDFYLNRYACFENKSWSPEQFSRSFVNEV